MATRRQGSKQATSAPVAPQNRHSRHCRRGPTAARVEDADSTSVEPQPQSSLLRDGFGDRAAPVTAQDGTGRSDDGEGGPSIPPEVTATVQPLRSPRALASDLRPMPWPIEAVKPYAANPRLHSAEEAQRLADFIRRVGWRKPIEVDEEGVVLCGHRRLEAARLLGMKQVPVVQHRGLSDADRRAYRVADNQLTLEGEWSTDLLYAEMLALEQGGWGIGELGFSDEELAALVRDVAPETVDEQPVPPVPAEPITRRGDVWVLGHHRVMCGDARLIEDLETLLEGRLADAVWTDPPYNVAYENAAGAIQNDALGDEEFAAFLKEAFASLIQAMSPGAPIYVAHSDTGGTTFRRAFTEAGFKLASCLIWRKNALVLSRGDYHWQHEPILYGWKPGEAHRWYGARDQATIRELEGAPFQQVGEREWQIVLGETTLIVRGENLTIEPVRGTVFYEDKPTASPDHPTMKPVPLIQRMLANSARRGDRVLDPFGGSGSTLIACEALGMHAHLIELDERYVDVIVARWENLTGQKARRIT